MSASAHVRPSGGVWVTTVNPHLGITTVSVWPTLERALRRARAALSRSGGGALEVEGGDGIRLTHAVPASTDPARIK